MCEEYRLEYRRKVAETPRIRLEYIRGTPHRFGWHAAAELMAAAVGSVTVYADGRAHVLEQGDLLLLGPNCGHFYHPLRPESRAYILEASALFLSDWCLPIPPNRAWFFRGTPDILHSLERVAGHLRAGEELDLLACEATTALLFIDLVKQLHAESDSKSTVDPHRKTPEAGSGRVQGHKNKPDPPTSRNPLIDAATRYIEAHYAEPILLSDISKAAGCSKTYLSSLFKQQTGISPSDCVTRHRLRCAVDCMASPAQSILDIALRCGFPDSRSLVRTMKTYCGMTPAQYRALLMQVERHKI